MASPPSSSPPSTSDKLAHSMAQCRVITGSSPYQISSRNVSSNADVLLPDSGDELSDRVPLLTSSVIGSTPYSFKYLREKPGEGSFDTPSHTDSSIDRSFPTPSSELHSSSSASMEIFLGPQPLSYVQHRHRLLTEDFDRSPGRPVMGHYSLPIKKGIAIMPDNLPQLKAGNQQDAVVQVGDKQEGSQATLSRWRQEQMKKFKPGRPVSGARERPIPVLHGPLSLPYARNPSGVDATIADQSSYMSHAFGIRSASSTDGAAAKLARLGVPGARIVSDPTNIRSASGSSYLSGDFLSTYQSSVGGNPRSLSVRDSNRAVGMKHNALEVPVDTSLPRSRSHSDLRSHLGHGKPFSTISGPPTKTQSSSVVYDDAIHSASSVPWNNDDQLSHAFTSLALVDPVTNSIYNVRVPQSSQANGLGAVACEIIPLGTKVNPPAPSSKADASNNWRSKSSGSQHHVVFEDSPKAVPPPPPPTVAKTPTKHSAPGDILTVDSLYEKFASRAAANSDPQSPAPQASKRNVSKATTTVAKSPAPAKALGESTGRRINIVAATKPDLLKKKGRSPATNTKTRSSSSPHPYHNANRAKGTPGAGMHLKRGPTDTDVTPSKTKNAA